MVILRSVTLERERLAKQCVYLASVSFVQQVAGSVALHLLPSPVKLREEGSAGILKTRLRFILKKDYGLS